MYDIIQELFAEFGLNYVPETFPELIVWFVCVVISLCFIIYFFDLIFIVVKAISGRRHKV